MPFWQQNVLQLSNYWANVKMNPIFVFPVKQCIQLMFPFEKFKNRRKSTYYSSENFSIFTKSWSLLKYNCPYQNLMEITKMWTILINNQHLRKKLAFFCFFSTKNMQQVINYGAYAKRTPRTAINAFLLSKFFSFINRVSREAWFRSRSLADITTAREGAYRPGGSGGDGFGERDWSYKPCGCTAWR